MSGSQDPRLPVLDRRRSGVLLHVASLAHTDEHGTVDGGLGAHALRFIDWLADAGFNVWQMLPLGPTGGDGSPYWARSDHAGNPAMLDRTQPEPSNAQVAEFAKANPWVEDYALFDVLGSVHHGAPWWEWPAPLRDRDPEALAKARRDLAPGLARIRREQCQFEQQWQRLRAHAHSRGIRLFGDLPIYVAPDSVTTWTQREFFQLTPEGRVIAVAGVPPDYFSEDGQLWGNPLYEWERLKSTKFKFWIERLRTQLARYDVVRIDHFRALAAYWSVPAGAKTARGGEWKPALGREMLTAVQREFPDLPFVAEDLGVITPDVDALRKDFRLPGMRVLQFAFDGGSDNPHLPFNYERDNVIYTGTHDNDTTAGWVRSLGDGTRGKAQHYLRCDTHALADTMVRETLASVGQLAVVPAQDLLGLGSEARINVPGTVQGNWSWKLSIDSLSRELAHRFRDLNQLYGRI